MGGKIILSSRLQNESLDIRSSGRLSNELSSSDLYGEDTEIKISATVKELLQDKGLFGLQEAACIYQTRNACAKVNCQWP